MWPWGHLAIAYLCYFAVTRLTDRLTRSPHALIAVVVGSQFPDLVDKPLAWTFAVLPSGRSLAHSLLSAAIVLGLLYWLAGRYDRRDIVAAFGLGWVSHSLSDLGPEVVVGLLIGDSTQLQWTTYLLWPLLPTPPYASDQSFMEHFRNFTPDTYVLVQCLLFGLAFLLWAGGDSESAVTVRDRLSEALRPSSR